MAIEFGTPIVEIQNLTRRFGHKTALDNVSLTVPAGSVFGLIGENGAGKTTLIKHMLGLLKAQQGSVRLFGADPVTDPVGVLSRVGYFSEESDLPDWMRVAELMRYTQAFYPSWDEAYAEQLRHDFGLDPATQLAKLSKGQRARVGLLAALAYRPDLLLLDEPSAGLDPIVRRDILAAIIRTIADEGRTVFFSSHLLSEIERVSDYVAMIRQGKIVFCDTLENIKATHFQATLQFAETRVEHPYLDGALQWQGSGREWTVLFAGHYSDLLAKVEAHDARIVSRAPATLDEIFVARVGAQGSLALED